MFLLLALACTLSSADPTTLEGTWQVDEMEFDSGDIEDIAGSDWSGEVEIRATGVGSLTVTGEDTDLDITLETEDDGDGVWHMGGNSDGLYILDMHCMVAEGLADCVDSGEIDWSDEDSDVHVTLLSLSAE